MTGEELRTFAKRQPFRPFRIILTTGATFDVRHPDLIMVGNRVATIGMSYDPKQLIYDYPFTVDLFHVVGVQELPADEVAA
jgi:hypothetical protein